MALHSQFKLKIVTWNVNSVKARLNNILNYIKDTHPDIILLQETKTEDKSFPIQEFKNAGYYVEIFGQKSYNGVAIISKFKPELVIRGLPNFKDDTQARYIQCEIKNFVLSSIYIPNGNPLDTEKFIYKITWLKKFKEHIKTLISSNKHLILGGDWNIAPRNEDVYDPNSFKNDAIFHDDSKKLFREIENLGLIDTFRIFNTSKDLYTYFDYQRNSWLHKLGVRIDHFLVSPYIADKLLSSGIDEEERGKDKPSDHVPLWCKLELN